MNVWRWGVGSGCGCLLALVCFVLAMGGLWGWAVALVVGLAAGILVGRGRRARL